MAKKRKRKRDEMKKTIPKQTDDVRKDKEKYEQKKDGGD